jgi:hypothetical protein
MKFFTFLLLVIFCGISVSANAQSSGAYYDPERSGEGLFLETDVNRVAFGLFTFWDNGVDVPPVFSPTPPPNPLQFVTNFPMWYVGAGEWGKKDATGDLYAVIAYEYPMTIDFKIGETIKVGSFRLLPAKNGYRMLIECAAFMPSELYMCNNEFDFSVKLIGE